MCAPGRFLDRIDMRGTPAAHKGESARSQEQGAGGGITGVGSAVIDPTPLALTEGPDAAAVSFSSSHAQASSTSLPQCASCSGGDEKSRFFPTRIATAAAAATTPAVTNRPRRLPASAPSGSPNAAGAASGAGYFRRHGHRANPPWRQAQTQIAQQFITHLLRLAVEEHQLGCDISSEPCAATQTRLPQRPSPSTLIHRA